MFFKLFWSLLKEKYDFFSPSWTGCCYTVVQLKGKFYIFSALWRPSIAQKNSGKALQPVTSGGAAMKSFSLFLGPGSTEHSLVCSSQWQWSLCTLNCFDWCCLPSVWKSFLCKQHRGAWTFTAPAIAVSEELIHTSMFAGNSKSAQESSHSGKKH